MQKHVQLVEKSRLPSSQKRQAILVLGMHRSGTSALGGAINALGVAAPKTILPPNHANPRGFWECAPLVTAHDELLASAGSCWHDWRQLNPRWIHSKAAERYHQEIKTILTDEFGDEPLIFIKDPRVCRFVPFMLSILAEMNVSLVAFLSVRNPLEVAYSLKRRDEIALPKSLLLWLRHVLEAEYHSRHMPRCFLQFEKLLIDWRYQMDRAAEKTGVIWPAHSDRSDAKIEQFLELDLHHEKSTFDEIQDHPRITSLVRETYRILATIATNGENKDLLDQLDVVRTKFDEGCELFGAAVAAEELAVEQLRGELGTRVAEAERLQTEVAQRVGQLSTQAAGIQQLQAALEQHQEEAIRVRAASTAKQADNQRLTEELHQLRAASTAQQADNQGLTEELHQLHAASTAQQADNQGLTSELCQLRTTSTEQQADNQRLTKELHQLRATSTAQQADNQRLTDELHKSAGKTEELRAALTSQEIENKRFMSALDAVHNSRSWRATKPFRVLGLLFRGILMVGIPRGARPNQVV